MGIMATAWLAMAMVNQDMVPTVGQASLGHTEWYAEPNHLNSFNCVLPFHEHRYIDGYAYVLLYITII